MIPIDFGDAGLQSRARVQPVKTGAIGNDVGIRNLYQFHRSRPFLLPFASGAAKPTAQEQILAAARSRSPARRFSPASGLQRRPTVTTSGQYAPQLVGLRIVEAPLDQHRLRLRLHAIIALIQRRPLNQK